MIRRILHQRSAAVGFLHLVQIATLVILPIPHLWKVPAQLQSGYVPPGYLMFVTVLVLPLALAALTALALVAWWRGVRRFLIGLDAATMIAAWTVLIVYVFSSELPVLLVFLAPICLVLTSVIAWRARREPA